MSELIEESRKVRASGAWRDVASSLQGDIFFGRLQPSQHLIEDEIMETSRASRHAVRRAFEELERSGLVVRLPNKGVRVRSFEPSEVENLYELRETLEIKAAMRMRLPVQPELIARLDEIQQRHESAYAEYNVDSLFFANNEFHETLYGACGNTVLAEAIKAYSWQTQPIRMRFITSRDWHSRAVDQHREMIRLLSTADNQALAHVCYDHLQPSKRFYLSMYHK